jgi:hypothetical protein
MAARARRHAAAWTVTRGCRRALHLRWGRFGRRVQMLRELRACKLLQRRTRQYLAALRSRRAAARCARVMTFSVQVRQARVCVRLAAPRQAASLCPPVRMHDPVTGVGGGWGVLAVCVCAWMGGQLWMLGLQLRFVHKRKNREEVMLARKQVSRRAQVDDGGQVASSSTRSPASVSIAGAGYGSCGRGDDAEAARHVRAAARGRTDGGRRKPSPPPPPLPARALPTLKWACFRVLAG